MTAPDPAAGGLVAAVPRSATWYFSSGRDEEAALARLRGFVQNNGATNWHCDRFEGRYLDHPVTWRSIHNVASLPDAVHEVKFTHPGIGSCPRMWHIAHVPHGHIIFASRRLLGDEGGVSHFGSVVDWLRAIVLNEGTGDWREAARRATAGPHEPLVGPMAWDVLEPQNVAMWEALPEFQPGYTRDDNRRIRANEAARRARDALPEDADPAARTAADAHVADTEYEMPLARRARRRRRVVEAAAERRERAAMRAAMRAAGLSLARHERRERRGYGAASDAYWSRVFAVREPGRRSVEETYWSQFLEGVLGMSREEQDADLEAVPGGYGLSSSASLWRAESQLLEEDAAEP